MAGDGQDFLEDGQEETGWKLVHGDVFRPPVLAGWLSVCVGTGVQVALDDAPLGDGDAPLGDGDVPASRRPARTDAGTHAFARTHARPLRVWAKWRRLSPPPHPLAP